ncbi:phosphatase PAP2 family protein [Catenulispora subtropica]|uniref:Phosphatidic acid phosphatase type 2/haloperoxidase domain-containing protein n=1 Tax=Catenulispora subtropica TaxID=450798 RepID=A0ABP5DDA1_9ACTN
MLYQPALAVDRHTATVGARRELRTRLLAAAVVAFVGVFLVYLLAVRTRWGQDFENAALAGARQHRDGTWYAEADRWLNRISAESFGLSLAVIGAVGLLRRRHLLAVCGVLAGLAAVVGARILKDVLPGRPVLGAPAGAGHAALQAPNTLPSGHAAAVMGLFCAAIIVVSGRWYVPVTLLGLPGAAIAGAATVAAHWHRLSDAVAADLLVLAAGLAGLAVVAQLGLVLPTRGETRSTFGQRLMYAFLICLATAALAVGAGYALRYHGSTTPSVRGDAAYWSSQALAVGAAVATAGAMLGVCRRLESVGQRPRRTLTIPDD